MSDGLEPMGAKLWLSEIAPRLKARKSADEIASELKLEPGYVRDFIATWTTPHATQIGPQVFSKVKDTIAAHYYMERTSHYVVASLFVLQAHVAEVLPVVFYLFVGGTAGTGKTNFLSVMASLTDALQFENVSIPAMARTMSHGRTVTMDEYDVDRGKEHDEIRDALVRNGYKASAPPYVRWDAAKKSAEEIAEYGPRLLGYRGTLDEALQGRGFVIPSVKKKGEEGYGLVLKNFWPEIGELPALLRMWGQDARAAFPPAKLKEIAYSKGFREKVKSVVRELGANRESELVTIALLVAEMAGVDVLAELREANDLREMETFAASDSVLDDLREVIVELGGIAQEKLLEGAPEVRLRQGEVRKALNRRLKDQGKRPIGDRAFARARRDVGIKDDWLRRPGNALTWVLPLPYLSTIANMANINPYGVEVSQVNQVRDRGEDDGSVIPDESWAPIEARIREGFRGRSDLSPEPPDSMARRIRDEFQLQEGAEDLILARIAGISEEFRGREDA